MTMLNLIVCCVSFLLLEYCAAEVDVNTDQLINNQILERLRVLENQAKTHQERIAELESRDVLLQEIIIKQQQRIEDIEKDARTKQTVIDDLEENVKILNQRLEIISTIDQSNDQSISQGVEGTLGIQNKEQDMAVKNRRQLTETDTVAFTAILTHIMKDLGADQNIIFNQVETNIGNAYNVHHGVFIAPTTGTYVFHVTTFALSTQAARCKIVVNGRARAEVYATGNPTDHNTGSQLLVVHLSQGDDVAVQGWAHDNIYGDGNLWTSFSGFLIHSDVMTNIVG
ncbi:hypothetical protein ACF0H5_002307 [Mactra antiquata]